MILCRALTEGVDERRTGTAFLAEKKLSRGGIFLALFGLSMAVMIESPAKSRLVTGRQFSAESLVPRISIGHY